MEKKNKLSEYKGYNIYKMKGFGNVFYLQTDCPAFISYAPLHDMKLMKSFIDDFVNSNSI